MNDKNLKINFLLILKEKKKYLKTVFYIHSPIPMDKIWDDMARVNCPNNDFSFSILSEPASQLFQASETACHCSTSFEVKIQLDHFSIGDGRCIDVYKFILA